METSIFTEAIQAFNNAQLAFKANPTDETRQALAEARQAYSEIHAAFSAANAAQNEAHPL